MKQKVTFLEFNPIQDRGGGGGGGGGVSPVTSANVGIVPKNFLTFHFNPFAILV